MRGRRRLWSVPLRARSQRPGTTDAECWPHTALSAYSALLTSAGVCSSKGSLQSVHKINTPQVRGAANERPGADAGWRVLFAFGGPRPRAAHAERLGLRCRGPMHSLSPRLPRLSPVAPACQNPCKCHSPLRSDTCTPTQLLASECQERRFILMFAWRNKISRSRIFERGWALKSAVRDLAAACFRPRALRVHLDAATMKGTAGRSARLLTVRLHGRTRQAHDQES